MSCPRCSLFTFGIQNTRITRITRKMRVRSTSAPSTFFCAEIPDKILIIAYMHFLPNSTRPFTDEWSCCSSCKQEDHCILRRRIYIRSMLSRASRYTSPEVAASARAGKRHRYSDRACPRSIGADRLRDHPSVFLTCLPEYSGRATEKYLSDPCFRCNPCFRYRPVCRHPQYCTQRKYKRVKFLVTMQCNEQCKI